MYKHKGVNGVLQSQKSLQKGLVGGKIGDPWTPPRNVNCCKPIRMRNYDVIFARTILIGRGELIAQKSYGVQNERVFWLMIVQQWKKILTCSFFVGKIHFSTLWYNLKRENWSLYWLAVKWWLRGLVFFELFVRT